MAFKRHHTSQTMLKPKTPESNKSEIQMPLDDGVDGEAVDPYFGEELVDDHVVNAGMRRGFIYHF